jgi:DNA helicase II / ATP-dependent DNA helicase PcrA
MPSKPSHSRFIPDDRQRQAIEHVHGPLLVVAGAGTGKTSVLTHRIAHLVEAGHARPDEILALTYTKNAVAEMKERLSLLLGAKQIHVHTFHDYCLELLKQAGKDFGVLDDSDLWIYLRRRMRELHLEYFVRAANVSEFLKDLLGFIGRCHDELVTPEKYSQYVARLERGELRIPRVSKSSNQIGDEEVLGRCREIARVFELTERWLKEDNLGTFSHMITGAQALLESDAAVRETAAASARFILVDEFQDTNFSQVKILASLAGAHGNIFAVGDPDQAIYRFRGASSAAFELFYRQFPTANRVVLGTNRRSRTPILRCAFALIKDNPPVFDKHPAHGAHAIEYARSPLQSARDEEAATSALPPAALVEAISFATREAESSDVVASIKNLRRKLRCKWSDFGILYRQHFHRDAMVRELADANIPFIIESMDVSDAPEIRDLFSCLSVVLSDGDDVSLFRVAALPQFQLDPAALRDKTRTIAKNSREGRIVPLASAISEIHGGAEIRAAIVSARETIRLRQAKGRAALEIIARQFQLDTASPILQAAFNFVETWEGKKINRTTELSEFVEYLSLFREFPGAVIPLISNESEDAVRLMTVHLAKGLEFPHVFILRAVSPSFPLSYRETLVEFPNELRDPDSAAEGDTKELTEQEERRLFYVAMTRACDSLHMYGKQGTGKKDPTPPGFLRKLMQEKSLGSYLTSRTAVGAPLDIFAAASTAYGPSRVAEWLDLKATDGLHAQLSASAVDTYERCPLQFKIERDWRIAARPAAVMQYGASMHRVLKTYFDSVRAGRPRTQEELINLFCEDLAAAGLQDPYQHELYEKQGIAQLTDFVAAAMKAAPPDVLHTEEWFDIRVGETKVIGRIDRMDRSADGSVVVVDYKTGRARDQEDADESLQLSIYAMAAREKWGYDVHSLVFHNLEENVPVATRRTDSQLREACDRVATAAANIAAGIFKPKMDFHCSFCSYRALCPAKEKSIPNPAPARASD